MACFEAQVKYHIGPFLDFISIQFIVFMALPRAFGVPQSLALPCSLCLCSILFPAAGNSLSLSNLIPGATAEKPESCTISVIF